MQTTHNLLPKPGRSLPRPMAGRFSRRRGFMAGLRAALAPMLAAALAACGGGGGESAAPETEQQPTATALRAAAGCTAADGGTTGCATPLRLQIRGTQLLDAAGKELRQRGVNFEGVSPADVDVIADQFHMNMIRLRISYTPDTRSGDDYGFTKDYRDKIDAWVAAIQRRKLWMVLEVRANDNVANSADLYDTGKPADCAKPTQCANFGYYLKAWQYLAKRYRTADYIAGYGLLAEPSPDRTGSSDPAATLITFQRKLMDEITRLDARTPFFIGPAYNYDTMEYADPRYFTGLSDKYAGRLVYEVNFLMPKEWVQDGSGTPEYPRPVYPFPFAEPPKPSDYDRLILGGVSGQPIEKTFNLRRIEPANYPLTLSPGFIPWYLQWAVAFRNQHQVPMYVDQFGASSTAAGQLAYERDLLDYFEQQGLHWTRWSYNAYGNDSFGRTLLLSPDAGMPDNSAVIRFYAERGKRW
jgi:hypothetical protein